jgi:hypothetical protein
MRGWRKSQRAGIDEAIDVAGEVRRHWQKIGGANAAGAVGAADEIIAALLQRRERKRRVTSGGDSG